MPDWVDLTVGIPTRNRSSLLARAIRSVLRQSYRRFTLIVSDNASDDDTADVVTSFGDPRITYRPLEYDIGMHGNLNRIIELAETEFVLILNDDDELRADHLSETVAALKRWPTVGVAHTGYVTLDLEGNVLSACPGSTGRRGRPVTFERGAEFIERSIRSGPTVCFSSATFRTDALISGGGLRPEDGVIDDLPLLLRIATDWDFVFVDRPLAVLRAHAEATSSSFGSFTPDGFRSSRALPDVLRAHRRKFLQESALPDAEVRRLERLTERAYRRDVLGHLSMRATTGDRSAAVFGALGSEIRRDRRLALNPWTWRFVVGQLGVRRMRDGLRRALAPARHRTT